MKKSQWKFKLRIAKSIFRKQLDHKKKQSLRVKKKRKVRKLFKGELYWKNKEI